MNQRLLEVVDGQQRLTTLSLLLAALYQVFQEHKDELDENQLSDARQLKLKLILRGQETQTHVVPQVQNNKLKDYLWILGEAEVLKGQPYVQNARRRRISRAYHYFVKRIQAVY